MMQLVGKVVRKGIRKLGGTGQTKKADRVRQAAGKKATDLGTPAKSSGPGREADLRSGGPEIREPTPEDTSIARGVRIGQANKMQKAYNNKKKKLKVLEGKAKQLSKKASPGKKKTVMGRHMSNQKLKDVKEEIQRLETSMKDMVNRYNIEKKSGGKIMKKRHGGMTHVGLSPAEEARAGTMPQVKRRRYMKKGGTVSRAYGGSTKGSKPISTTGSYKGKKQLASWQSGLSADAIKKILGITTRDPETGIQSKLKTPAKKKKVVKARKGGQVKRISHKQLDGSQLVGSTYD